MIKTPEIFDGGNFWVADHPIDEKRNLNVRFPKENFTQSQAAIVAMRCIENQWDQDQENLKLISRHMRDGSQKGKKNVG